MYIFFQLMNHLLHLGHLQIIFRHLLCNSLKLFFLLFLLSIFLDLLIKYLHYNMVIFLVLIVFFFLYLLLVLCLQLIYTHLCLYSIIHLDFHVRLYLHLNKVFYQLFQVIVCLLLVLLILLNSNLLCQIQSQYIFLYLLIQ